MADQLPDAPMAPQDPAAQPDPAAAATQKNRSVTLLIALGSLAIIVGVIVALVVFVFSKPSSTSTAPSSPAVSTGTASKGTTATAESKEPAAEVANSEVFTFRDIFKPLLSKATSATASATGTPSSSSSSTATSGTSTPGTLYLTDISSENGAYAGTFVLDGKTYKLGNGKQVGSTPWQVVTLSSGSAVMLYGDTRVTITVGQGISK